MSRLGQARARRLTRSELLLCPLPVAFFDSRPGVVSVLAAADPTQAFLPPPTLPIECVESVPDTASPDPTTVRQVLLSRGASEASARCTARLGLAEVVAPHLACFLGSSSCYPGEAEEIDVVALLAAAEGVVSPRLAMEEDPWLAEQLRSRQERAVDRLTAIVAWTQRRPVKLDSRCPLQVRS
jgi:hypothetical protein